MYGAIIGDIVGSIYEGNNIKRKDFDLFGKGCCFTDDTVMTCAVASALMIWKKSSKSIDLHQIFVNEMQNLGRKYLNAGYGRNFRQWIMSGNPLPYGSCGNGSAMRVSPVGWVAESLEEALDLAKKSAEVSHNHPEGIKGAQSVAGAISLARIGKSKEEIKGYIEKEFYDLSFSLDDIRDTYTFDVSCQGSVPQAIVSFLDSEDFEGTIRNAISIGGDSDTIGAIAGSIGDAFYGVPSYLKKKASAYLPRDLTNIVEEFGFLINPLLLA
ncbi:ADP-ribosylglycohydrolase family protein [Candidatus Contubernalis alkaliaceticus]|uniref:ADP-ribosylglycohydrolase family protein n=1 Tax=Candidatus Contubernalis alkaliaceticus TaxID=338645 RepID=UPI001F4C4E14|nr:ADP-ribosylglycohydrolase family protein [Candidatus Contubernalis alkalaceticus]UNC91249.1 ADP-ribosylglycohydrolase family protein [Candidatus Contubernalis alkalaceticus]